MPRYDDRYGNTRLYVGHLSSRTRSRDLDHVFSRYGRIRNVDMKRDYAFVEFSDPRDADDARHSLNGRDFDGSRIIVEFAKGEQRGPGSSREYLGKGPAPGSGRCFNCGLDGHWARDCKAGDWKNKCYRCGERGHIERNCKNSPKKLGHGRSYSRSPVRSRSPRRGSSHGRRYSRSGSYSRSRSPPRRERIVEREERRSRSRDYSRSPKQGKGSLPPSKSRKRSPTPDDDSPVVSSPEHEKVSPPPSKSRKHSPTPDEGSPRGEESPFLERERRVTEKEGSIQSPEGESPAARRSESPYEDNGNNSRSPSPRDDRSPVDDDEDNQLSPGGSESS